MEKGTENDTELPCPRVSVCMNCLTVSAASEWTCDLLMSSAIGGRHTERIRIRAAYMWGSSLHICAVVWDGRDH